MIVPVVPNMEKFQVPYRYWDPPPRFRVHRMDFDGRKKNAGKNLPARTSTPIRDLERFTPKSETLDDFFYQSWKNDLHPNYSRQPTGSNQVQQPIQSNPQVYYCNHTTVYVNLPPPPPRQCLYVSIPNYYTAYAYRQDGSYGLNYYICPIMTPTPALPYAGLNYRI